MACVGWRDKSTSQLKRRPTQALQPVSDTTLEGGMMARERAEAVPLLVCSDGTYPRLPRFLLIEDDSMYPDSVLPNSVLPILQARSVYACPALVERPLSSSHVGLKS